MKKVFFLILVIASFSLSLKAQEYEFVSAKQAYVELVSGVPNLFEDYELIDVGAESMPMLGIEVDFETGNAHVWVLTFKSKIIEDESIYDYTISKKNGKFSYELEVNDADNAHDFRTLESNWKNSTDFANEFKKSPDLTDFYNTNKELISMIAIHLKFFKSMDTDVWGIIIKSGVDEYFGCVYQATSLEVLLCDHEASSVQDKLSNSTKLFPQPSKDYLNIELPFTGDVKLELYNTTGIVLKSMNLNTNGDVQFNTADLPTGVYNLVIKGSNSTFSKKVIVTR